MWRRWAPGLLLWLPGAALAHSPMPGIGYFYGGILHPLLVPSQLLALLALGLLVGQGGLAAMRLAYPCFLGGLVAGLVVAGWLPESPAMTVTLLVAAAGSFGLATALQLPLPRTLVALAGLLTALLVGADSGVADLGRRETFGALLGAGLGACIVMVAAAALAELPRRNWQRVLVRVAGSWCAASAVMVLALALR